MSRQWDSITVRQKDSTKVGQYDGKYDIKTDREYDSKTLGWLEWKDIICKTVCRLAEIVHEN